MSQDRESPAAATVFGVTDQAQMVAKIDAVADDDLTSTFFVDSMADVEGAATRVFDVGIRTITHDAAPTPAGAFGAGAGTPAAAGTPRSGDLTTSARLQDDADARRAFILGGPTALS